MNLIFNSCVSFNEVINFLSRISKVYPFNFFFQELWMKMLRRYIKLNMKMITITMMMTMKKSLQMVCITIKQFAWASPPVFSCIPWYTVITVTSLKLWNYVLAWKSQDTDKSVINSSDHTPYYPTLLEFSR